MKITIKGSPRELAELAKVLVSTENKEKNADFPPLLTELTEDENTSLFFGDGHIQTGDEIAATIKHNHEIINRFAEAVRNAGKENNAIVRNAKVKPIERTFSSFKPHFQAALERFCGDDKINGLAKAIENADKEDASQTETAKQMTNQEIIEKQMELLSEASKFCSGDVQLAQYLPELTRAMIELNPFCRQPARGR